MATQKNIDKFINDALAIEARDAYEAGRLGYYARILAQATMPHKATKDIAHVRKNGGITLSMTGDPAVGLPYGSVPRLLLAWLSTEVVKKKDREIPLGNSLTDFMRKVGIIQANEIPTGGKTGNLGRVKTQADRLFNATVNFSYDSKDLSARKGFRLSSETVTFWGAKNPDQKSLWQSRVVLSQEFFDEVTDSPIPVDLDTLRALRRSPLSLDLYIWLTYRMSYLKKPTEIPWGALQLQFGSDYKRTRAFKGKVVKELKKVEVLYPELRLEDSEKGLILRPSPTHIKRLVK